MIILELVNQQNYDRTRVSTEKKAWGRYAKDEDHGQTNYFFGRRLYKRDSALVFLFFFFLLHSLFDAHLIQLIILMNLTLSDSRPR